MTTINANPTTKSTDQSCAAMSGRVYETPELPIEGTTVRVYAHSPNIVALQIRSECRTTRSGAGGKMHKMISLAHLTPAQCRDIARMLNEVADHSDTRS